MNKVAVLTVSFVLTGCASQWGESGGGLCDSEMVKLGPDTYLSSGKYGNGCGAEYKIKHAGIFCAQKGKELLVTSFKDSPNSQVVFQCLEHDDSDLQRPTYEKAPDIVIETK